MVGEIKEIFLSLWPLVWPYWQGLGGLGFSPYRAVVWVCREAMGRLVHTWKKFSTERSTKVPNMRILDMPVCEVLGNYMVRLLQTSKLEIKEVTTCPRIIVARPEKEGQKHSAWLFVNGFTPVPRPCGFSNFPQTIPSNEAFFRQRH